MTPATANRAAAAQRRQVDYVRDRADALARAVIKHLDEIDVADRNRGPDGFVTSESIEALCDSVRGMKAALSDYLRTP